MSENYHLLAIIHSMKISLISLGLGLLAVPVIVLASPVIRSGETVTVGQDQMVTGDLYAVGGSVSISGAVEGDAFIASGAATINAPISADVLIAAGSVQIHAPVGDDVRAVGGEITLADEVVGDIVVAGGSLRILSTAVVHGDIIFYGGELTVEGAVDGSIFGSAESVRIDAAVRGNVELHAYEELVLGDRTHIDGYLTYESSKELVRSQNAVIVGDIQREEISLREATLSPEVFLFPLLMLLFAALTVYLLLRKRLPGMVRIISSNYGVNGLVGLAILGGVPFAVLILFVSVLGILAGLLLLTLYAAFVIFAYILASIVAGVWLMKLITKKEQVSAISVGVGVLLFQTLAFVPFIGFLAILALIAITMGSLAREAYSRFARL